jgi:hypothetical protein
MNKLTAFQIVWVMILLEVKVMSLIAPVKEQVASFPWRLWCE